MIHDQGEVALVLTVDDLRQEPVHIEAYTPLHPVDVSRHQPLYHENIARHYLSGALLYNVVDRSQCDKLSSSYIASAFPLSTTKEPENHSEFYQAKGLLRRRHFNNDFTSSATRKGKKRRKKPPEGDTAGDTDSNTSKPSVFGTSKKYKPVARKVKPVISTLPSEFRIVRRITGDPLKDMPTIQPRPPDFTPTGRYTQERMNKLNDLHADFLHPEELRLMHHFMMEQNEGFAWDDSERGRFKPEFFPPVEIPTIAHEPWIQKNIPIPPGIYKEVCEIIKTKISAGVYEPSNSSYRSRWFCVLKKDGRLRIVHSLEPLNAVTIQHSGVTPIPEHMAENFACRSCGGMFDLYVGYDERLLSENSRDLTTFQTPFGAMRLVTLPMGWTNSVPIFHDDVTYILQPEIPDWTIPYIDDVPVKGPASRYQDKDGNYETIPENDGIRRFVWEHFQNVNRIVQRMKYCGGTFSGKKLTLCSDKITVVGHLCTYEGRLPDPSKVAAIVNWGPCNSLSEVRAFLGTIGVVRIFVKNFAYRAHALIILTKKNEAFVFGKDQLDAMNDLKQALLTCPALVPLDYTSPAPVILAVDSSNIAIGIFICQCDKDNPRIRYYSRFDSITLNDRESRFSQPKIEIYGLYRALRKLRLYLIGVRNLVVEVDARYIKGMLQNPDIAPSASINRWILAILTFHFKLVHVPGTNHGPDGLSRRPRQPDDEEVDWEREENDFDDWVDNLYGFMHMINSPALALTSTDNDRTISTFASTIRNCYVNDFSAPTPSVDYSAIPRTVAAQLEEDKIAKVIQFLDDLQRPLGMKDEDYAKFVRYCMRFFVNDKKLWRRHPTGAHKLVVPMDRRFAIMQGCHDETGHKGFFATRALISERFWWPHMHADVQWYVRTCHLCQQRQLRQIRIPPVVASPATVFAKIYIDTMHLPKSSGFQYIVQARCSLTHYPEFKALRRETGQTIGDWIYQDIICRWGALSEIVTDNGTAFVSAVERLSKKYHINHIRISGYNSRANGIVERPHFDVRQSLFKAADGDESKWAAVHHSVFWAERVTVRRRLGISPYFAVTGTQPLLPLDIVEATYLLPPPTSVLSTTDLIARRAIELQRRRHQIAKLHDKVYTARIEAARRFERDHPAVIKNFDFKRGDLVLARNTAIEKSLNKKMRPRYIGPYIVVRRNRGGAYILCELDGAVLDRPLAAFRLVPYFAREKISLPQSALDTDDKRLEKMAQSQSHGDDDESDDEDEELQDDGNSASDDDDNGDISEDEEN